jgi:hypothetical protein
MFCGHRYENDIDIHVKRVLLGKTKEHKGKPIEWYVAQCLFRGYEVNDRATIAELAQILSGREQDPMCKSLLERQERLKIDSATPRRALQEGSLKDELGELGNSSVSRELPKQGSSTKTFVRVKAELEEPSAESLISISSLPEPQGNGKMVPISYHSNADFAKHSRHGSPVLKDQDQQPTPEQQATTRRTLR